MHRRTFLAATGVVGLTALPALPATASSQGRLVGSLDELQAAIVRATPGSVITVADGTYEVSAPITITGKRGTRDEPIVVRAESVGGVVLTGEQSFVLSGSSDVTISGFAFRQRTTLDVPPDCRRIRLTRNDFQLADIEGLHWVMVRADYSTIDRNEFHGKSTLGIYLGVEGAGTDGMARGVHITRNYFRDHTFPGDNGGEPIRLGLSPRALSTAGAVVEFNLFERANGDPEAISVKSSGNTIRHNTIRDSLGGIVLRHGNATRVEGNYLLSGENGIRIYGNDHLIVNNYVERISGTGVVLGSGNVRDHYPGEPADSRRGNDAPDRVRIALNTVLDCEFAVSGESHRTLPPLECAVTDNLLVTDNGQLVNMPFQDGITWSGNIHWGQGTDGNAPAAGFTRVDPRLAPGPDGVRRLTAGSPAINAASQSYPEVAADLDGDHRTGRTADVGADEYSARWPTYRPLTSTDVGPHAR
ncbi:poly(beta-D-mannuronate) lyase [Kribbella sp. VKM Ac-2569]|uniref:polysaccharide lyase 6 family protein n=1 Tax=Kribbella sp. VKM Ac-2569 TaxID=2512220 RepID=UPI00102C6E1C|nr:polysaccharide lyase 6 family protein [Kribbella sp. VKM Ac-2569]RZT17094.1 poly(beta-D-mannuronate) lyase [Kribbella sp. VKM Ac-2569]